MLGSDCRCVLLHLCDEFLLMSETGNSVKAGVRFVSYDHFKHLLADSEVSRVEHLYNTYVAYQSGE